MKRYNLGKTLVFVIAILFIGAAVTPIITGSLTIRKNDLSGIKNPNTLEKSAPIANFTYEPANPAIDVVVYFNSTSYDPNGTIANWSWHFGDGGTAYGEHATHQYTTNGTYMVNLTVKDDENETAFIEKSIFVGKQSPVADFTFDPENPTNGDDVYFTDGSNDPDGEIVSWWWNFGDGYYSDVQNPIHRYYLHGSYYVDLTVTDDDGKIDMMQKAIEVHELNYPPSIPSNPYPEDEAIDVDTNITLSWTCSDPDEDPLTYDVYFGNITPPPQILVNHNEASWNSGELGMDTDYYWQIVAWDDHGNSEAGPIWSFTTLAPENDPPEAPFVNGDQWAVVGQEYSLTVQSPDPNGDDVKYTVTWGDNTEDTTELAEQNTPVVINHTWQIPYPLMILRVTVKAEDTHEAESTLTEKWVIVSWFSNIQSNMQQYFSQQQHLMITKKNSQIFGYQSSTTN